MSMTQPTTAELVSRNLANIEGRLGESTPTADKAFNKVLAVTEGLAQKPEYAYMDDLVKANFALTAQGDDLDKLNINGDYNTPRNPAVACKVTAKLSADDTAELVLNTVFVGPQGLLYDSQASVTAPSDGKAGDGLVIALKCEDAGTAGSLAVGDELTIQSPLTGIGRTATVTAIAVAGSEKEEDEDYRVRLLDVIRAEPGGGNSADFRLWGEAVSGVKRVYPFSGVPYDSSDPEYPGMRTVYVEATESYDADGIADSPLLALVRAALLADPDTGADRQILGLTTDTLYVQSIARKALYVTVVGLTVNSGSLASAETKVEAALTTYLKQFGPFVQGLDADFDRLDTVTPSLLSHEVQDVLKAYGGTCQNILMGTVLGTNSGTYTLKNGEKLKLGSVVFEAAS
jgi:uncharacterized phage protein gp47/JayE